MLLAFALACAACIAFSFAMDRHLRQVWPQRRNSRQSNIYFRAGGTLLLSASAVTCCLLQGVGTGLASLFGLLTAALVLVAVLLAYYPRGLLIMVWSAPLLVVLQVFA